MQDTNATLTLTSDSVIDTSGSCSALSQQLNLSAGVITAGSIDGIQFNSGGGSIVAPGVLVLNEGVIPDPQPLTQQFLSSLEGVVMETQDGSRCTVTAGNCISDEGQKYVVVDGQLVEENNSAGAITLFSLLLLLLLKRSALLFCGRAFTIK